MSREWRFKGNSFTEERGLDTADMETFKKDPIASLTREICQNSIDAKLPKESKVLIEFHSFKINKEKIPGIDRLRKEIISCIEYTESKKNQKIVSQLKSMLSAINKSEILCLRISDKNTKGLLGVSEEDSPFYLLTKGSGITDKIGTEAGSKGIGKYASFVASKFNTVFYSTYNMDGETGCIGISKLCSTRMPGNTKEKTIGTGYYGSDNENSPILEQLDLDNEYVRRTSGTDVYILGFKGGASWKQEIVENILDNFMAAIIFEELEIKVEDIEINKSTLDYLIENIKNTSNITIKRSIVSQYILLKEMEGVCKKEISIGRYGNVTIYVKNFDKENMEFATKKCVMIRYPYMKIKQARSMSIFPYSALCVIHKNELNSMLRDIENPQHTEWEIKRIEDSDKRKEVKTVMKKLEELISEFIRESLSINKSKETDIEGASEYLPGEILEEDDSIGNETHNIEEKVTITKIVKNKPRNKVGNKEDENGNSPQPDIGDYYEGSGTCMPEGNNSGKNGDIHDNKKETGNTDGDKEILRLEQLTGLKYTFFTTNKDIGESIITFNSTYVENDCELELYYFDDSNNKYKINLIECTVNDINIKIENGRAINFKLMPGRVRIRVITDIKGLYASEVKLYANRK